MKTINETIYLSDEYRTPGKDNLIEYRDSCFYELFNKSVKDRGNAYEDLITFALRAADYDVKERSHYEHDYICNGKKVELKVSRKPSPYDTRKRDAQYSFIHEDTDYDVLHLAFINPNDTVEIYETTYERIKDDVRTQKNAWNLAKHPRDIDADLIHTFEVK